MAKYVGREGALFIDGVEIGGCNSVSTSANKERLEVTAFGDSSKAYLAGLQDGSVSFDFFLDNADAGQNALAEGNNVTFVVGFAGTASAPMVSGLIYIDEVSYNAGVQDAVTGSVSATGHVVYQAS